MTEPPVKLGEDAGLKDLLRLDIRRLNKWQRSKDSDAHSVLGAAFNLAARMERVGKGRHFRVMACPPLTLYKLLQKRPGEPAEFIHRIYLEGLWRERGMLARAVLVLTALLWSVPFNLVAIGWLTAINGAAVSKLRGKSIARLVAEQIRLAFAHNITAPWYYQFDLHDDSKRAHAADYLHRFELKGGLYKMVSRHLGVLGPSPLNDKWDFAEICHAAGLPAIPEVGIAQQGKLADRNGSPVGLPPADLFTKPCMGRGGAGASLWLYDAARRIWRSAQGEEFSSEALTAHILALSSSKPYLVQYRARPHHEIADLSNGALPTARVLTIRTNQNTWEPVASVFRMAVGSNRTVDNFHAGGIAANVDMESGTLGRASDIGLSQEIGWCDRHPDTQGLIAGRKLPLWREVLDLSMRAHRTFSHRLVAGWDIAILDDGPVLVEGNVAPDTDMHQRLSGTPLGSGKFGRTFASLLSEAIAAAGNSAW